MILQGKNAETSCFRLPGVFNLFNLELNIGEANAWRWDGFEIERNRPVPNERGTYPSRSINFRRDNISDILFQSHARITKTSIL